MASEAEFDPLPMLEVLGRHGVDFVIVGGVAGGAHGSSYPTYDLDIAYERSADNLERLASALRELAATLRGAQPACRSSSMRRLSSVARISRSRPRTGLSMRFRISTERLPTTL